jgi:hypothetical protein
VAVPTLATASPAWTWRTKRSPATSALTTLDEHAFQATCVFHGAGVAPNGEDGEDGEAEGGEKGTDRSDAGMPQRV